MRRRGLVAISAVLAIGACGARAAVRESVVESEGRAPLAFERVPVAGPLARAPLAPPSGELRATAPFGQGATLVATSTGLFFLADGAWSSLDRAGSAVTRATDLAPRPTACAAREAWVREDDALWRVRVEGSRVSWFAVPVPSTFGRPRALAALGQTLAIATERGVAILDDGDARLVLAAPGRDIAGAAGFAWVAWRDAVVRTDGSAWTTFAHGMALATATLVPSEDGASVVVIDANGARWRIVADESLRLQGFASGARTGDTRLSLEALDGEGTALAEVDYAVDGHLVAKRTSAPWGWGPSGAPTLDVATVGFGPHAVRVDAKSASGRTFARESTFDYLPPAAGVPSYARDIVPLFRARCASCHQGGGTGRDLATYERLRDMSARLRASLREQRMPPDFAIDPHDIATFTAWIDGASPP
jgi:hypothetical protein